MAMEVKFRTKRLGRVHEEVYTSIRSAVDPGISDTTVFADLLAHVTGRRDLAEKLVEPADIAPMCNLTALRALVEECERIHANRASTTGAQTELPLNVGGLRPTDEPNEALAKAS